MQPPSSPKAHSRKSKNAGKTAARPMKPREPWLDLPHVAALVGQLYEREAILRVKGIHSFAPALRLAEKFTESAEELGEFRRFHIGAKRRYLANDEAFNQWFLAARSEGEQRYAESKKVWDLNLTSLERRLTRLQVENSVEYSQLKGPYLLERAGLWAEEVEKFSSSPVVRREWQDQPRQASVRAVFAEYEKDVGLIYDKSASTTASPVFSKRIGENWKIKLKIDGVLLKTPFEPPGHIIETGEILASTATLDIFIDICRCLNNGRTIPGRAFCDFGAFFPLGDLRLPQSYRSFGSLRQLEALLRIHIEMFRLIEPELVVALGQEAIAES